MKEANSPKAANTYTLDFFSLFILFYIGRDTFNHRLELFFYSSGITVWSPIYSKSSRKQHIRNKDILKEGYSGKSPLNFRWKQYNSMQQETNKQKAPLVLQCLFCHKFFKINFCSYLICKCDCSLQNRVSVLWKLLGKHYMTAVFLIPSQKLVLLFQETIPVIPKRFHK